MRRLRDGAAVRIKIGMNRMVVANMLMEKIDMVGCCQITPFCQQFPPRLLYIPFQILNVSE